MNKKQIEVHWGTALTYKGSIEYLEATLNIVFEKLPPTMTPEQIQEQLVLVETTADEQMEVR